MTTPKFTPRADIEHLLSLAEELSPYALAGDWATVEMQPDAFVPQRLTVGVVVQGEGERLHFKLLDDFKKFECLYGDRFTTRAVRELMARAEQTLRRGVQAKQPITAMDFGTSALSIGRPLPTSGDDWEQTIERLFGEVVVMAPHADTKKKGDFESLDTQKARQLVNQHLKIIAKMDFERIVTDSDGILLELDGQRHWLDVNLTPPGACGSVISAVYKTVQSVKINLLEASRDLTTYARVRETDDTGLFLLLPSEGALEPKEFERIDNAIREYEWKLERDGFRVVSLASAEGLATEVFDWAKPHLGYKA